MTRPLPLTGADEAAWAAYLAANKAAHEQYKRIPTALNHAGPSNTCIHCGAHTKAIGRVCRACQADERALLAGGGL